MNSSKQENSLAFFVYLYTHCITKSISSYVPAAEKGLFSDLYRRLGAKHLCFKTTSFSQI